MKSSLEERKSSDTKFSGEANEKYYVKSSLEEEIKILQFASNEE